MVSRRSSIDHRNQRSQEVCQTLSGLGASNVGSVLSDELEQVGIDPSAVSVVGHLDEDWMTTGLSSGEWRELRSVRGIHIYRFPMNNGEPFGAT